MAETAIAPHVDHDVALELLAEVDRELAREGHRLGNVDVDVQDRRLNALGDVRRIGRRTREMREGRKTDLVVDEVVDAATGVVDASAGQAEAIPYVHLLR